QGGQAPVGQGHGTSAGARAWRLYRRARGPVGRPPWGLRIRLCQRGPLMNPFKRAGGHYGRSPAPETPYQRAAQAWDDRIGSARVQARNWRLAALMALGLSGGLAAGLVVQSARGVVTPWIVEVDQHGEPVAISPAQANYTLSDAQIAWHLGRFVEHVRSISADPVVVRNNWLRAYDYTTDQGAAALSDFARTNDPFADIGRIQVG